MTEYMDSENLDEFKHMGRDDLRIREFAGFDNSCLTPVIPAAQRNQWWEELGKCSLYSHCDY